MKKINLKLITFFAAVITMTALGSAAIAQNRPYQVSERQVQAVLDRIDNSTNALRSEFENLSDNDPQNANVRADRAGTLISNFENATDNLKNKFSSRASTSSDVQAVLDQAYPLNTFMLRNNSLTANARNQWQTLRSDLDTLAVYYNLRTNWNDTISTPAYQSGYTVTDAQLNTLLTRLRSRERSFRLAFNSWARYGRNRTTATSEVTQTINEFETALTDLGANYANRNSRGRGIEPVLRPSVTINNFLAANRTTTNVNSKWTLVRNDLNTLAGYYRLSWDWNNPVYPEGGQTGGQTGGVNGDRYGDRDIDSRLTGTYRLNVSQSDNVTNIVNQALANANYPEAQRERARRMLERRLQSPETLAFEKRGQQITMSSSNAAAVTLQADGVAQAETSPNGRTVNTTVTATDRDVSISYEGDRMNDFYVSFTPVRNGQLRVTRRVNLEGQNQSVTVASVYDKTSQAPQWNTVVNPVNTGGTSQDRFLIPNNTSIVATLDRALSTKTAREGDRFSMTVNSPSQYAGAVIEGVITGQPSGVVSGRATMAITFQTIRLLNGQTYRFAGIVDQVRETNGNVVNVNNEGVIRDSSQTTRTVTRTGVGAVIGAIIGAIAGGGEGAAIGAGVGAGVGAGSVVLQGRDNLDLGAGTQFMITSTAPSNVGAQ